MLWLNSIKKIVRFLNLKIDLIYIYVVCIVCLFLFSLVESMEFCNYFVVLIFMNLDYIGKKLIF